MENFKIPIGLMVPLNEPSTEGQQLPMIDTVKMVFASISCDETVSSPPNCLTASE